MSGICGIAKERKKKEKTQMLDNLEHRGGSGRKVIETNGVTLGIVYPEAQRHYVDYFNLHCIEDAIGNLQFARAHINNDSIILERDPLLLNGWLLNTKEELFYYRLFQEKFGELKELDWIGRTKGAPIK
ncbi:MAG: hypothetical protein ACFFB5_21735 [Promethearchaeota archaeon]